MSILKWMTCYNHIVYAAQIRYDTATFANLGAVHAL
jgi:hypothetical protein